MVIVTECGHCRGDIVLNINKDDFSGTARMGHLSTDIFYDGGDHDLPLWDCPYCGYADSYDHNYYA